MVDANHHGLVGLDSFILEDNFKKMIQDVNNGLKRPTELDIPHFTTQYVNLWDGSHSKRVIAPVLTTRYGDKVIFASPTLSNGNAMFDKEDNRIEEAYESIFNGIDKSRNSKETINPLIRTKYSSIVLPSDVNDLDCVKYTDPRTEITYVYDSAKKIAFTIYSDEYIPESYGISEWVSSLPEKKISWSMLNRYYTVIGL